MMATKRIKPDFSTGTAEWIDQDFFPPTVMRELTLHLKRSPLTQRQREALLVFASGICQSPFPNDLETEKSQPVETGKRQREQIEAVAANASRLLASLTLLGGPAASALRAHADFLVYGHGVPVELDKQIKATLQQSGERLLPMAWDWIDALEVASTYAAKQFDIDKTTKPKQMRGRGYVAELAKHIQELTGSKPPKDSASWFAAFVECVGRHMGLEIGTRVVKSGIESTR